MPATQPLVQVVLCLAPICGRRVALVVSEQDPGDVARNLTQIARLVKVLVEVGWTSSSVRRIRRPQAGSVVLSTDPVHVDFGDETGPEEASMHHAMHSVRFSSGSQFESSDLRIDLEQPPGRPPDRDIHLGRGVVKLQAFRAKETKRLAGPDGLMQHKVSEVIVPGDGVSVASAEQDIQQDREAPTFHTTATSPAGTPD